MNPETKSKIKMNSSPSINSELKNGFKTLQINQNPHANSVYKIDLNNPSTRNALTLQFFAEFPRALSLLQSVSARAIILSARGPHFCSGIHLSTLSSTSSGDDNDELRRQILALQDALTAVEKCRVPVLAAVSGACVGAGVDLVTACDVRYCDVSAYFSVKEVDMALTADLGTLQRLPTIVGFGNAMEMALTGRAVPASEAKNMGLVSKVFDTREEMEKKVEEIAKEIAEKSGKAVMGTKEVMLKSRDMTVEMGLDYIATWNAGMLKNKDLEEAVKAKLEKRKAVFNSKI